jgi:hypothetical protein
MIEDGVIEGEVEAGEESFAGEEKTVKLDREGKGEQGSRKGLGLEMG